MGVFRPLVCVGAQDERQARWVHDRVEEIVERHNVMDWRAAKSALINSDEYLVAFGCGLSVMTHVGDEAAGLWEEHFLGKANTPEVLRQKAGIAGTGVIDNCAVAAKFAKDFRQAPHVDELAARLAKLETASFLLFLIDREAIQTFGAESLDFFMGTLLRDVARHLAADGIDPEQFHGLFVDRLKEYFNIELTQNDLRSATNVYVKRVAEILNRKRNIVFEAGLRVCPERSCWIA